jgi:hypothetical protein
MAYNRTDKEWETTEGDKALLDLWLLGNGVVAERLLEQRSEEKRKMGGITPETLQLLVGTMSDHLNKAYSRYHVQDFLRQTADDWVENIVLKGGQTDEAAIAVGLLHMAMHIAHNNGFDLYEAAYDKFDATLQDIVTEGKEAAKRLASKTNEED